MLLFVHPDKSQITDFIMWADVEFIMQLEIMERRNFNSQDVAILDLSEINSLSGIGNGETLYVVCHGGRGSSKTSLNGFRMEWEDLGILIGKKLGIGCTRIVLFACFVADGNVGTRGIDLFVKGLKSKRSGVAVIGYKGATVTTTFNAIGARDGGSKLDDPIHTLDESTEWRNTQRSLLDSFKPQLQFEGFLQSNPNCYPQDKAIAAAEISEKFYYAYGSTMQSQGMYYPANHGNSIPVTVTS